MSIRRLLHILAVSMSSALSMVAHAHAKAEPAKHFKKEGENKNKKSAKMHGVASGDEGSEAAGAEPPDADNFYRTTFAMVTGPERAMVGPVQPEQPLAGKAKRQYPWRTGIVTTTFWIGEKAAKNNPVPNDKSSWDTQWAKNYGGTDTPDRARRGPEYTPVAFTPGQNPFYIALPYNDIQMTGRKPEAERVIPWFKEGDRGDGRSVLKGRWLAIRYKNKVAYAQWEDCGPFRTDHWEYVFGNERPKPNLNKGAGLDVSPAVRDYLGMADSDVTDWKFVEFEDVPPGPWGKFGENNTFVQQRREQEQMEARLAAQEEVAVK